MSNLDKLKAAFTGRPIWMNALMVFCAYMTFIYMPFDLFIKPVAEDEEIWFGFMLHGWAAKATEPIHWAIYAGGFYGFLKMKSWMFPWAALYVFQVAIAMGVWPWLNQGMAPYAGIPFAVPFVVLGVMLWMAKDKFAGVPGEAAAVRQEQPQEQSQDKNDG
jgi:hypothetical protein